MVLNGKRATELTRVMDSHAIANLIPCSHMPLLIVLG